MKKLITTTISALSLIVFAQAAVAGGGGGPRYEGQAQMELLSDGRVKISGWAGIEDSGAMITVTIGTYKKEKEKDSDGNEETKISRKRKLVTVRTNANKRFQAILAAHHVKATPGHYVGVTVDGAHGISFKGNHQLPDSSKKLISINYDASYYLTQTDAKGRSPIRLIGTACIQGNANQKMMVFAGQRYNFDIRQTKQRANKYTAYRLGCSGYRQGFDIKVNGKPNHGSLAIEVAIVDRNNKAIKKIYVQNKLRGKSPAAPWNNAPRNNAPRQNISNSQAKKAVMNFAQRRK